MERGGPAAVRALGILTALVLALTGCVSGPTGPSPTDPHGSTTTTSFSTTTTLSVEESLVDYRSCLEDEGVSIPEIRLDGLGRPRMAEALGSLDLSSRVVLDVLEECGRFLSSGALELDSDPELRELVQESLEEFARCVRLVGVVDYPDPVPEFDGMGSPFPMDLIPWDDPLLPEAVDTCRDMLGV